MKPESMTGRVRVRVEPGAHFSPNTVFRFSSIRLPLANGFAISWVVNRSGICTHPVLRPRSFGYPALLETCGFSTSQGFPRAWGETHRSLSLKRAVWRPSTRVVGRISLTWLPWKTLRIVPQWFAWIIHYIIQNPLKSTKELSELLGDYPYGYTVHTRVQTNTHYLLRELSGPHPLCRDMDIVSKPHIWNHNTGVVSFECWPPSEIQGSGKAAIPATSIQLVPMSSPYLGFEFHRRTLGGRFLDIEQ